MSKVIGFIGDRFRNVYMFSDRYVISGIGIYDLDLDKNYLWLSDKVLEICNEYGLDYEYEYLNNRYGVSIKVYVPENLELKELDAMRLDDLDDVWVIRNGDLLFVYDYGYQIGNLIDVSNMLSDGILAIGYMEFPMKYVIRDEEGIRFWKIRDKNNMRLVMSFNKILGDKRIRIYKTFDWLDNTILVNWFKSNKLSDEHRITSELRVSFEELGISVMFQQYYKNRIEILVDIDKIWELAYDALRIPRLDISLE